MWRTTVLERIEQEAELVARLFVSYTQQLQHGLLHVSAVDTN